MSTTTIQSVDPYGLTTRQFQIDPYPAYAALRDEAPAYYSDGWGSWIVTRYQDVQAGLKDPRLSSNRAGAFVDMLPAELKEPMAPVVRSLGSWALLRDPPEHTRLRSSLNKAFTPRLVEYLRPCIEELVGGMLDEARAKGGMNVLTDLAYPLPVAAIGDMLGVPRADGLKLKAWSDVFANFFGNPPDRAVMEKIRVVAVEMEDYFRHLIARRRESGTRGSDLLSTMMAAEDQGRIPTEQELVANCSMVLFAGHETTTHLITNGLYLLLQNPSQQRTMLGSEEQVATAVDELLRFDSPIQRISRICTEDIELHGQTLRKGQRVWLSVGSANHDPSQFADPDRVDLTRRDNRHLAFGVGIHYCLGAALGRLEAHIALGTMLRRFPHVALRGEPERLESITFRGFKSLEVSLG